MAESGSGTHSEFRNVLASTGRTFHPAQRHGLPFLTGRPSPSAESSPAPSSFALHVPEFWGRLHYAVLTVYGRGMDEDLSMPSTVNYTISAAGCQVRASPSQVNLRTLGIRTSRISALTVIRCLSFHFQPASLLFYLYVFGLYRLSQEYLNGVVFS